MTTSTGSVNTIPADELKSIQFHPNYTDEEVGAVESECEPLLKKVVSQGSFPWTSEDDPEDDEDKRCMPPPRRNITAFLWSGVDQIADYEESEYAELLGKIFDGKGKLAVICGLILTAVSVSFGSALQNFQKDFSKSMNEEDMQGIVGIAGGIMCHAVATGMLTVAVLGFSFQQYIGNEMLAYNQVQDAWNFVYLTTQAHSRLNKIFFACGTVLFGIGRACDTAANIKILSASAAATSIDATSTTTEAPTASIQQMSKIISMGVLGTCMLGPVVVSIWILYIWSVYEDARKQAIEARKDEWRERISERGNSKAMARRGGQQSQSA